MSSANGSDILVASRYGALNQFSIQPLVFSPSLQRVLERLGKALDLPIY